SKIRVLFIVPSAKAGGVPATILRLVENIDRSRFHVECVMPRDGEFYDRLATLCPVHDIPVRGVFLQTLVKIRRLLARGEFDIVHGRGKGAGLYARLGAVGTDVKVVHGYHGFYTGPGQVRFGRAYLGVERLLLRLTSRVVFVSEGEMRAALRAGILRPDKAVVIPNGIDADELKGVVAGAGYTVGTLSRISVQKGLEYLLPAIGEVRLRYPEIRCLIAGGAQPEELGRECRLRRIAEDLGLNGIVEFLGEVYPVRKFFEQIDIYVSAALWEGLPTAVLEAFAARVPVVATAVQGNVELVQHGLTGIAVPAGDSHALAAGIEGALGNREAERQRAVEACDLGRSEDT